MLLSILLLYLYKPVSISFNLLPWTKREKMRRPLREFLRPVLVPHQFFNCYPKFCFSVSGAPVCALLGVGDYSSFRQLVLSSESFWPSLPISVCIIVRLPHFYPYPFVTLARTLMRIDVTMIDFYRGENRRSLRLVLQLKWFSFTHSFVLLSLILVVLYDVIDATVIIPGVSFLSRNGHFYVGDRNNKL